MISDQDILDKMRCDIMGVTQASSQLSPKLSFSTLFRSLPYLAMLLFFFFVIEIIICFIIIAISIIQHAVQVSTIPEQDEI